MNIIARIEIDKEPNEIKRSFLEIVADILATASTSTTILNHNFDTSYYTADVRMYQGLIVGVEIKRK